MGSQGQANAKTRAINSLQARVETLLLNPQLTAEEFADLADQLLTIIDDPIARRTLSIIFRILAKRGDRGEAEAPVDTRIPLATAAAQLGISRDHLRHEVRAGNIQCCARIAPGSGKGERGGAIFFIPEHIAAYIGPSRRGRPA